jgi:hypothetical protein
LDRTGLADAGGERFLERPQSFVPVRRILGQREPEHQLRGWRAADRRPVLTRPRCRAGEIVAVEAQETRPAPAGADRAGRLPGGLEQLRSVVVAVQRRSSRASRPWTRRCRVELPRVLDGGQRLGVEPSAAEAARHANDAGARSGASSRARFAAAGASCGRSSCIRASASPSQPWGTWARAR